MSHRVIQSQFKISSSSKASSLKNDVESKLSNKSYDLYESSVVDGQDMSGNATLSVTTKHNVTEEANQFSSWLKSWMDTNQASYNQDKEISTEGIVWARHKVHDCWHSVQGEQQPCEAQDYKNWDIRPEQ